MKPIALSLLAFTLLGCTVSTAQTTQEKADASYEFLKQKFPAEFPPGTTTGGTTTGGSTTGGTTTGGTTTGGTTTGGTTTGGSTTGGTTGGNPTYRTIFAMTDTSTSLCGWERCGNQRFPTGAGTVTAVNNSGAAHSGNYYLSAYRPSGNGTAMRLFQMHEYGANCQQKELPNETLVTFMVRAPQNYSNSFIIIGGWKQNQKGVGGSYNQPTNCIEFSSTIAAGLRANVKGANNGAASGSPGNIYVLGTNLSNPNQKHGKPFPINQWVRIDYYVKHSTGNDGYLRVYQDGELILHYIGRTMRENAPRLEWETTNYGNGNATTLHFDTFTLSTPN